MLTKFQKYLQGLYATHLIVVGLIIFGLVLRLRQYLAGRSLWLDEAMLALNIVSRNFGELLQPLDYNQGGPVGFLLLEKLTLTLLGNNELTLRLIPLLTGCAALLLFALLLRQMLGNLGLALALTIFAVAAPLVYYSSEVKQYSSDVFITLLLLWLGSAQNLNHEESQSVTKEYQEDSSGSSLVFLRALRGNVFLALAGALALWCSHPAIFTLTGVGAALLLQPGIWKERARLLAVLLVIGTWAASFALLYLVSLGGLAANNFLLDYWTEYFMPLPPWNNWGWFPATAQGIISFIFGVEAWWPLVALLMLLGLVALLRNNLQFGVLLALPLFAALGASALGKYPFAGRMILFAIPIFIALAAAGVESVVGWLRPRWLAVVAGAVLVLILFLQPLVSAGENFIHPKYPEHIRPTMTYLQENHKPDDAIYVYYWAVPAFRYYAPFYGFSENNFLAGNDYAANPPGLLTETDQFKGRKRVWVLFSHVYENGIYNEKDALLAHLNQIGVKKREFRVPGTSVNLYLYDLAQP